LPQRVPRPAEPLSSRGIYDATYIQTILLLKASNCAGCIRIVLAILLDRNLCGRESALHVLDIGSPHGRV
jgi:hypothetical protein